jgi:hypothetical protein
MKLRFRRLRRRLAALALGCCLVALALPAASGAAPAQDLRSPDTRDAAANSPSAKAQDLRSPDARDAERFGTPAPTDQSSPQSSPTTTVIRTEESGSQTLPIALASAALGIALAGTALALLAFYRRPRPRWTAG